MMNKNLLTNGIAAALCAAGVATANPWLKNTGLFALSGALTNWLAIHMLFEKVPGLYGSGVIPARFEEFKTAVAELMMTQFFQREHLQRFLAESQSGTIELAPVIDEVDFNPAFDGLLRVVKQSSLGGMLAMFGGSQVLEPMREPFIRELKLALVDVAESEQFQQLLHQQLGGAGSLDRLEQQIGNVIMLRLAELTPDMVKTMVQKMIKEHLGWLVVWGGVFGGIIGLAASAVA